MLWFIWAFLNDSQGRLNTWTNGKYGNPPSKDVLEQRAAADKNRKTGDSRSVTAAVPETVSAATVVSNAPASGAKP
jgi:hypothetical protein